MAKTPAALDGYHVAQRNVPSGASVPIAQAMYPGAVVQAPRLML